MSRRTRIALTVLAWRVRLLPGRCIECKRRVHYSWRRSDEWLYSRLCGRCLLDPPSWHPAR